MRDQKAELDILKNINKIVSQKSLADELGYSAGKINYVLKALIEKGFIKSEKFISSDSKIKYKYLLTTEGIKEKINITKRFIEKKKKEYDELSQELEDYQVKYGDLGKIHE